MPVSGAAARPIKAIAPSATNSRYGKVSGDLAHSARQPAISGPIPSAPTVTAVPMFRARIGEPPGFARARNSIR